MWDHPHLVAQLVEYLTNRLLGWPISNQPGTRIRPGRDAWQRWFFYFGQSKTGYDENRWMTTEVLPSQRLRLQ